VYVISRTVATAIPSAGYQDIKESLIPRLHRQGKTIAVHVIDGELMPRVTCPTTYLSVNRFIMGRMAHDSVMPEGCTLFNGGWVHRTARVDPSVRFAGPVLVGPGTEIQPGAMVMGPTSIGCGCVVGRDTVVSRSALWNGCVVGDSAILEHCVVADNTRVEDGEVMRNTVCIPPRRPQRGLWGRLASLRLPGRATGEKLDELVADRVQRR
jgi:mannose-1-phosphate guanylyltransferase